VGIVLEQSLDLVSSMLASAFAAANTAPIRTDELWYRSGK
jgi:hypothetical protein